MKSLIAILGVALLTLTGCQPSYQAPPSAEWIAFVQSATEPPLSNLPANTDDPEIARQRQLVEAAIERSRESGRVAQSFPDWQSQANYKLIRTESAVLVSLANPKPGTWYSFHFDKRTGVLVKTEEMFVVPLPEGKVEPEELKAPSAAEALSELMALAPSTEPDTWVFLEPRADKPDILLKRQLVEIVLSDVDCTGQIEKHNPRWKYTMAYALERGASEFSIDVIPYHPGIGHSIKFDSKTGAYLRISESIGCP